MKLPFKIKRLTKSAILPTRAYEGDLGYDLYADETITIRPLDTVKVQTNICVQFPPGWGGFIKDRSSMASKHIITTGGVIDSGYTGPLSIILTNIAENDSGTYVIQKGAKIAQLVPIPVSDWEISEVDHFEQTERSDRGFGSSDTANPIS